MTNVGHTASDKHLVDLLPSHVREQPGVIGVVGRAQDGLFHGVQVNVQLSGVLGALVGLQQLRVLQPGLHLGDAAGDRACVSVAFRDHPFQQRDVGVQVFDDRLFVRSIKRDEA